jgi:hypothetical protein
MLARQLLGGLRADQHSFAQDLEDAPVVAQWRVVLAERAGPYLLEGRVAGQFISKTVIALDAEVGRARTLDRWYVLGERAPSSQPIASPDEIMRAAAAWIDMRSDGMTLGRKMDAPSSPGSRLRLLQL